jgi:autotransporter-associated beta strand protein
VTSVFSGVIQNHLYDGTSGAPIGNPTNCYVQLTKWGAGTLTLTGTNTFVGNISVHSGVLRITYQNGDGTTGGGLGLGNGCPNANWPTYPSKVVNIDSSTGDAGIHFLATNGSPIVVSSDISFQTAGTNGAIVNEAGNNIVNGTVSLRTGGGTTIRVDADTLTLASNVDILPNTTSRTLTLSGAANGTVNGVIADGSSTNAGPNTNLLSLTKAGTGTWTLRAANTYSGSTVVNAGLLALTGNSSIANTPQITIAGGATFDVSGLSSTFTLASTQTLSNSTSTAVLNGSVNAGSGTISLTYGSGTPCLTVGNGTLTLTAGGVFNVNNTGPALTAGSYLLISKASSGAVSGTVPPVSVSGLAAGATAALQISGGQLYLVVTGGTPPHITSIVLSGTNVILSGTNGATGQQYEVLTSTNLAVPVQFWNSIETNTFTSGNFSITNPINPNARQSFYILRMP